jgi:acyl carrier protein
MTIAEVKERKRQLEQQLADAIIQFEELCGVPVTTIYLTREELIGADSIPHIEVTAEVV